ncbi:MAG: hypothetical protein Q8R04_02145 [Nanoarchaeota archaeon]|nr:hypothetical protein [Nanoarchaeota archaeon]
MKKYLFISYFIFLLVFMIACAPVQKESAPISKSEANAGKPSEPVIGQKQEVSAEVKELLDKSKTRVRSIYYKYKGPETGNSFYEFYAKDAKIKYLPALEIKSLDAVDSYDTIFIDKTAKTAVSYCVAYYCKYKGKKQDLNYDDVYISTVLDWVSSLTSTKKVGEEVIDDRSTWKIETNKGILWVDTFYGIPLKVESSGKTYRFQQISVNSVQDADVVPS